MTTYFLLLKLCSSSVHIAVTSYGLLTGGVKDVNKYINKPLNLVLSTVMGDVNHFLKVSSDAAQLHFQFFPLAFRGITTVIPLRPKKHFIVER